MAPKISKRKAISPEIQATVLTASGRRCCLCWGLKGDFQVKRGQIAHIDQNNANNQISNLAFLCLECHDEYDSRSSQSKGLLAPEVRLYRDNLYGFVIHLREIWSWNVSFSQYSAFNADKNEAEVANDIPQFVQSSL